MVKNNRRAVMAVRTIGRQSRTGRQTPSWPKPGQQVWEEMSAHDTTVLAFLFTHLLASASACSVLLLRHLHLHNVTDVSVDAAVSCACKQTALTWIMKNVLITDMSESVLCCFGTASRRVDGERCCCFVLSHHGFFFGFFASVFFFAAALLLRVRQEMAASVLTPPWLVTIRSRLAARNQSTAAVERLVSAYHRLDARLGEERSRNQELQRVSGPLARLARY
jgi:hypothetical protein